MGSSQSSDSFSIDPSGNITKPTGTKASSSSSSGRQNQQSNSRKAEQSPHLNDTSTTTNPDVALVRSTAPINGQQQADGDPSSLSLQEAEEIVTRMKTKYKPNSAKMAGKQKSVFEDIEQNLAHCYKTNKDQPLNCAQMAKEYQHQVKAHRNRILKRSLDSSSSAATAAAAPTLLASLLVIIISSLLFQATTVHCFGAMSVDLGSEWMKVGLVAPSVQMDLVLNAQSQRKTAMAIAFVNGVRYVGDSALDVASKYPEKTFTHFLDLVGKTIEDEPVKIYNQRFPFVQISSHQPNSSSIILNHPEGMQFTPLELIAMMLQHAHDQVVSRLNNPHEISNDVVITVPPFFNSRERAVIKDAAKLVGLNVLRLTNVNSAFALSYGIFRHKDYEPESSGNRTSILFVDQGASHTSATLADYHLVEQIDDSTRDLKNETLPTVTIRAQVYDRYLGGLDMQLRLRDYLVDSFAKQTKIDKTKIYKRGKSAAKLFKEAGKIKRVLSANAEFTARVENVIDDKDLKLPLTRKDFEEINDDLMVTRLTNMLDMLYELPEVSRDEKLQTVLIVGANTRTPKVQQVLMDYFKLESLGKSINADEGAALAALYQAASLGRGFRVKKFVLEEFGEERKRYDPAKVIVTTTTPAPSASDESSSTTESPPKEGVAPAEDTSGEQTKAAAEPTATESDSQLDPDSIYSPSELLRMSNKLAHLREQDFSRHQRLSLRNSLESLLSEARDKLDSEKEEQTSDATSDTNTKRFNETERAEIERIILDTHTWLDEGPDGERDNVTLLAEKFTLIYDVIHPRTLPPPPPPPPAQEEEATEAPSEATTAPTTTTTVPTTATTAAPANGSATSAGDSHTEL